MHIDCGSTACSVGTVYGGLGTSIYSWRLPCFGGDALSRLMGDHPVASLAITLLILSMVPNWWRPARLTPEHGQFSNTLQVTTTPMGSPSAIVVVVLRDLEA
jgi:hypothetical protein